MNKATVLSILRFLFVTLWRLALLTAALAALAVLGLHMTLQTIFCGPSEAARNELTLTLLESEKTRDIPGRYLDQATIDAICAVENTLTADVTDPKQITVAPAPLTQNEITFHGSTYTAQIKLLSDPAQAGVAFTGGENFAGFTGEGKLILATSRDKAASMGIAGSCGHILILNGQPNDGLFAAHSGYAPRTAIGQRSDGTVILVTTDGWTKEHPGATYRDLINLMIQFGAVNACITQNAEEGA